MAFFLIVPSVMIVSILLVHALAKRLGLKIYYSTLTATAIVSIMIIFAAVMLSPVPDKKFLAYLGGLVLATSFLLTLANNFLIKRQRIEEKNFTEEVKAAYAEEIKKDAAKSVVEEIVSPIDKFEWKAENFHPEEKPSPPSDPVKEDLTLESAEEIVEPVENQKPLENFPLEKVFEPLDEAKAKEVAKTLQAENAAPLEKPKPEENFPLQEVFKPLSEIKPVADETSSEKLPAPIDEPKPEENFPLQETFKPLEKVKPEMLEKIQSETKPLEVPEEFISKEKILEPVNDLSEEVPAYKHTEEKSSEPIATPAPIENVQREEKISEPLEKSSEKVETLDDILDKAYDARGKGHIWQAIEQYRKALERYRADEYAPFVAIDLGNIYKENALYSKAIKTFEDALNLPAVKRNASIKNEFTKNLDYLRVVRDVLLKNRALTTPFGKIPKEILQEIDSEFQKTQIHSAQYK